MRILKSAIIGLLNKKGVSTPFLLVDEAEIKSALNRFKVHLPDVKLFYATKANSASNVLQIFANEGLGFDVAGIGEIEAVLKLGVDRSRLFLSTPIKSDATIKALFALKIGACAVDSFGELNRLAQAAKKTRGSFKPKVFVRFKVDTKDVAVNLNTKFGCSTFEAIDIISRACELGFEIGGLCFHVGTQCTNVDNYFLSIRSAMLIADECLRRFNIKVPVINIGGGFCDPATAEAAKIDIDAFYKSLGQACRIAIEHGFEVYAEPGRCLVSAAGTLVSSIIGKTERDGKNWLYLNEGLYGCYSIKLYENTEFSFYTLGDPNLAANQTEDSTWTIAGPTCDSLDIITKETKLSAALKVGDTLLTTNMGAYTIATASNFNGFPIAQTLVFNSDDIGGNNIIQLPKSDRALRRKIQNA